MHLGDLRVSLADPHTVRRTACPAQSSTRKAIFSSPNAIYCAIGGGHCGIREIALNEWSGENLLGIEEAETPGKPGSPVVVDIMVGERVISKPDVWNHSTTFDFIDPYQKESPGNVSTNKPNGTGM